MPDRTARHSQRPQERPQTPADPRGRRRRPSPKPRARPHNSAGQGRQAAPDHSSLHSRERATPRPGSDSRSCRPRSCTRSAGEERPRPYTMHNLIARETPGAPAGPQGRPGPRRRRQGKQPHRPGRRLNTASNSRRKVNVNGIARPYPPDLISQACISSPQTAPAGLPYNSRYRECRTKGRPCTGADAFPYNCTLYGMKSGGGGQHGGGAPPPNPLACRGPAPHTPRPPLPALRLTVPAPSPPTARLETEQAGTPAGAGRPNALEAKPSTWPAGAAVNVAGPDPRRRRQCSRSRYSAGFCFCPCPTHSHRTPGRPRRPPRSCSWCRPTPAP